MTALMKRLSISAEDKERSAAVSEIVDLVKKGGVGALKVLQLLFLPYILPSLGMYTRLSSVAVRRLSCQLRACQHDDARVLCECHPHCLTVCQVADVSSMCFQAGGLGDRLAESAASATDPLARQGAFETYTALMKDIGAPIEPFVAGVLSTMLDKCSDKVRKHHHLCSTVTIVVFRLLCIAHCCCQKVLSQKEVVLSASWGVLRLLKRSQTPHNCIGWLHMLWKACADTNRDCQLI